MKRIIAIFLIFLIVLPCIVFAEPTEEDSKASSTKTSISKVTLDKALSGLESQNLNQGTSTGVHQDSLDVLSLAMNTQGLQEVLTNAYLACLLEPSEDQVKTIVEKVKTARATHLTRVEQIDGWLAKLQESASETSETDVTTTVETSSETTTASASTSENKKKMLDSANSFVELSMYESTMYDNMALDALKKELKSELSSTVPQMYDNLLSYCEATEAYKTQASKEQQAFSFMIVQLETLSQFNTVYNTTPDVLAQEDALALDVISGIMQRHSSATKEVTDKVENATKENLDMSQRTLDKYEKLHQYTAFVQMLDQQVLEDLIIAEKRELTVNDLTGPEIWEIVGEQEAPFLRSAGTSSGYATISDSLYEAYYKSFEGPALRDTYLAMFAATSVYTPFHSKMGESDYMEAFYSLLPWRDKDELNDLFNQLAQYKKPLFFFTDKKTVKDLSKLGYSYHNLSGNAQRLTLGDLTTRIDQKGSLVAVTIPGKMIADGNAWTYYDARISIQGDKKTISETKGEDSHTTTINSYTRPVLEIDNDKTDPTPGTLTAALLYNIYQDEYIKSYWESRKMDTLYLNVFGDILLQDGTIVLPAASNPVYFAVPYDAEERWWYNPYTVAFWNSYPVIYGSTSAPSLQAKKDKYKWVVGYERPQQISELGYSSDDLPIHPMDLNKRSKGLNIYSDEEEGGVDVSYTPIVNDAVYPFKFVTMPVRGLDGRLMRSMKSTGHFFPFFTKVDISGKEGSPDVARDSMVGVEVMDGAFSLGEDDEQFKTKRFMNPLRLLPLSESATQFFPYQRVASLDKTTYATPNSVDYLAAKRIAANMFNYISIKDNWGMDETSIGNGLVRESYIYYYVVCSVLDGMVTPVAYEKSTSHENILMTDAVGIIGGAFVSTSRALVSLGKNVPNLIGVGSPDEKSALAPVYRFIHTYGMQLLFLILVIMLFVFIRYKSFSKVVIVGSVLSIAIYGFLYLVPRFIPIVFGAPMGILSDTVVGNTLLVKGEQYDKIYSDDPEGIYPLGSIKLYELTLEEALDTRKQYGYKPEDFMTNKVFLNDEIGLFLQGTEVRLDLKKYWAQCCFSAQYIKNGVLNSTDVMTVRGVEAQTYDYGSSSGDEDEEDITLDASLNPLNIEDEVDESAKAKPISVITGIESEINAYQIVADNHMPDPEMINYYTPLLYIQDGIVETLNYFLLSYKIPRSVIVYPDGFAKDTYIFPSYVNSYPFLSVLPVVQDKLISEGMAAEQAIISQYFADVGDVLRLQPLVDTEFEDLPLSVANSVWGQTMFKNGYYDPVIGKAKRQDLVNKTNDAAYAFLINVTPDIGLVSDENLIRLLALYATFEFNGQISRWGDMVYPRYVAFNELSVSDILTSAVLHTSQRFMSYDVDLVSNIYVEKGGFGLFAADLTLLCYIGNALINSGIAYVYILSLFMIVFLVLKGKSFQGALGFFIKTLLLLFVNQTITIITLTMYPKFGSALNIYLLALISLAQLIILFKLIVLIIKKTDWISEGPVTGVIAKARHQAAVMTGSLRGRGRYNSYGGYGGYNNSYNQYGQDGYGDYNGYYQEEEYDSRYMPGMGGSRRYERERSDADEEYSDVDGRRYNNY